MKILYDHQIFSVQKFGGISRYFYELNHHINQMPSNQSKIGALYTLNSYLLQDPEFQFLKEIIQIESGPKLLHASQAKRKYYSLKNRFVRAYCEMKNRRVNKKFLFMDFDIFHPTYYQPYFIPYLSKIPFVTTIHDMTYEIFPQYFSSNDPTPENKKLSAFHSKRIIAISQNTKKDILKFLNVDPDKIDVIYHGNSLKSFSGIHGLSKDILSIIPEKYILYIGARDGYKYFQESCKMLSGFLNEDPDLYLVIAGAKPFSDEEKAMFNQLGITSQVIHLTTDDRILAYLYQKAAFFIYPSLYEGFGIPILEAWACGCPVLLSDQSCFPEIGDNAVSYFNPQDAKSFEKSVKELLYNQRLRLDLIDKGTKRLKLFNWEKTAAETLQSYQKALKS